MINQRKINAYLLLSVIATNCILLTFAYPQSEAQQLRQIHGRQQHQQQQQQQSEQQPQQQQQEIQEITAPVYRPQNGSPRKFAVKPNAQKKVALDDIEEDAGGIEGNQITETPAGFSWSNMLSTFLTMFFNGGANNNAPTKSDDVDGPVGLGASPWANIISMGLKIINTLLGGGAPSDGIDKVDNGASPMQGVLAAVLSTVLGTKDPDQVNSMAKQTGEFIMIVMNLLDALKTSFSHRSIQARSIGKRDSVSDAAVAGISMLKSYVKTYRNADDKCLQRYMCEANNECISEIGGSSIFCQLGSYATSYIFDRTSDSRFETLYDAGRRGRSGFNCQELSLECNEV